MTQAANQPDPVGETEDALAAEKATSLANPSALLEAALSTSRGSRLVRARF
jgi:hypothetical protein